jgi:hypothetical protein
MRSGAEIAMTFPSQALPCSGSTGFSQPFTAPRGRSKNKLENDTKRCNFIFIFTF